MNQECQTSAIKSVITVTTLQVEVFWVVMLCSIVIGYKHFRR